MPYYRNTRHFNISYALSLALPLALLRAKIFLPFLVLILLKKPCSLFLCLFLG